MYMPGGSESWLHYLSLYFYDTWHAMITPDGVKTEYTLPKLLHYHGGESGKKF